VRSIIIASIVLALVPAGAQPYPSSVTYHLGGAMSGPYRLSVDLEKGVVSEATPPPDKYGDGAGLRTSELPETASRTLTAPELDRLRKAAEAVWDELDMCQTVDALGRFVIVKGGKTKDYSFSIPCMSPAGDRLFHLMSCGAHPERPDCKPE